MRTLKFQGHFKQGDIIRAYDFQPTPTHPPCYVEGKVVDEDYEVFGAKVYVIECTRDVFGGMEQLDEGFTRKGTKVFVPHEVLFGEFDTRLERVEA